MTRAWAPKAPPALACPICRAPGPIPPLLQDRGHRLHRCPACRSCFYADRTPPRYETELETPFYQQLYLEQNGSIHHVTRFLFLVDDPVSGDAIDSVLDVGCGFGFGVDLARRALGWRAVGIDPSHYGAAGAALLGADIRDGYLSEASDLGAPFALVVASEVIEHVPDAHAFLLLLRRRLRPGGTLVLTTPDADAVEPHAGEAELASITAPGIHLVLFSAGSLTMVLRRAGFAHVEVEGGCHALLALASDAPIRRRPDAAARHLEAYQAYLAHLVETALPASPLWNGAAGRLFQLQAAALPLESMHALFARIAAAWTGRYGIDLRRQHLPALLPERAMAEAERDAAAGKALMFRWGPGEPMNLATVLFARAVLEDRRPGRLPEDVLRWARPAYAHAVQTARVLAAGAMVDLDLRQTAQRARLVVATALAELAPELEGELLAGVAASAPGALAARIDLPPEALAARIAPLFTRLVQADRFDEARRLEPWVRDMDLLHRALRAEPGTLYYALFTLGVLRMVGEGRADEAALVFERLAQEAALRRPDSQADSFYHIAREHVAMAATWGVASRPAAQTNRRRARRG